MFLRSSSSSGNICCSVVVTYLVSNGVFFGTPFLRSYVINYLSNSSDKFWNPIFYVVFLLIVKVVVIMFVSPFGNRTL